MDFLVSLEYLSTISTTGDYPEYVLGLRYLDEDAMDKFSNSDAFEITRIIEQRPGYTLLQAKSISCF